ncbi:MAG: ABC transporter permease [Planctomycetes bacterium]|nr:ABC transporter permease [Planctomycetota bacterium]
MERQIHNQVHLPNRVALQVVLQGIRVRFGRSLVTLSGVALGVAFLMSIFTGQAIKAGVRQEETLRNEVGRMVGFLTVEVGPVAGRAIAVVQVGPLDELENRLLRRLEAGDVAAIRWATVDPSAAGPTGVRVERVAPADATDGAIGLILMGQPAAAAWTWPAGLDDRGVPLTATGKALAAVGAPRPAVALRRELTADEAAEVAADARRARFRTGWIVTIALLVTVIGIANAMLMSVTERFREIGTMKCLGALGSFIRRVFLIESSLIGAAGSVGGALFGMVFSTAAYSVTYGPALVVSGTAWASLVLYLLFSVAVGMALSVLAAIYPAHFASNMAPAAALRSNI